MKKVIITIIVLANWVLLISQTTIPEGDVLGNWSLNGSPYLIEGEITIPNGETLSINPGVEIIFQGHYKFIVYGKLFAVGTVVDSINFTAEDIEPGWHGLRFIDTETNGQDGSVLAYCIFEYGNALTGNEENTRGGVLSCLYSSDVQIMDCRFSHNQADYGGAIELRFSDVTFQDCIISNNYASHDAGGILMCDYSVPTLNNVIISNNSCVYNGGGIFCSSNASPILNYVTITENTTICDYPDDQPGGGGISCWNATMELNNVAIFYNISNNNGTGGGIECRHDSEIILNNCLIYNNEAQYGGGIYNFSLITMSGTSIHHNSAFNYAGGIYMGSTANTTFDPDNRCSIYLNNSIASSTTAYDLYNSNNDIVVNVIVDSFTVMYPNIVFACPMDNFTFDILNCSIIQLESDVFVSPEGSNENSGLSPEEPFLNISHAYKMLLANSLNSRIIHLDNGTYSLSQTGERFPLSCRSDISIVGADQNSTILDGEGYNQIFSCRNITNLTLKNMMLQNSGQPAGTNAIFCENTDAIIENLTIFGLEAHYGNYVRCAAISCYADVLIRNVNLYNNEIGIRCSYSSPVIINATIYNDIGNDSDKGIYVYHADPIIVNSIIWNNAYIDNGIFVYGYGDPSSVTISNTDILGGETHISMNNNGTLNWLEGNIDADPLFCDPSSGNFHLQEDSPCIDAGTAYFEWNGEVILDLSPDEYYGNAPDMGAFEWDNTTVNEVLVVLEYNLYNHPNPFNPTTTIEFTIQNDSEVELSIFNIKGQKIKSLVKTKYTKGSHSIIWNGDDESEKAVSSGIYYYRLNVNGKTEAMKKCLLLK